MKASLSNYRQTPRKVRLVANGFVGKPVAEALALLPYVEKKAATQLEKVLRSALANAKEAGVSKPMDLVIKSIRIDKGTVGHRYMARARGSGAPIKLRSAHIAIELAEKTEKKK